MIRVTDRLIVMTEYKVGESVLHAGQTWQIRDFIPRDGRPMIGVGNADGEVLTLFPDELRPVTQIVRGVMPDGE